MKTRILRWLPSVGWVALVLCLAVGCATVPETGRRQLVLLSSSEEMQLGLTSFDKMKKDTPISRDAAATAALQKVAAHRRRRAPAQRAVGVCGV